MFLGHTVALRWWSKVKIALLTMQSTTYKAGHLYLELTMLTFVLKTQKRFLENSPYIRARLILTNKATYPLQFSHIPIGSIQIYSPTIVKTKHRNLQQSISLFVS